MSALAAFNAAFEAFTTSATQGLTPVFLLFAIIALGVYIGGGSWRGR